MDLEPPTDLLHGLNRIRCNGSRIMVGSRDFTSASEALEAYLDQYAGLTSKHKGRYRQNVSDLLDPKSPLHLTADRSLQTGVRDTPAELRLATARESINESYDKMKRNMALRAEAGYGDMYRVDEALNKSGELLKRIASDERLPRDVPSDIESANTDTLINMNPGAAAQRKGHVYSYKNPRNRSKTVGAAPQKRDLSSVEDILGGSRRSGLANLPPPMSFKSSQPRERSRSVSPSSFRHHERLASNPARQAYDIPVKSYDLNSSRTQKPPSWIDALDISNPSESFWSKRDLVSGRPAPSWVNGLDKSEISSITADLPQKRVGFSENVAQSSFNRSHDSNPPGLDFNDLLSKSPGKSSLKSPKSGRKAYNFSSKLAPEVLKAGNTSVNSSDILDKYLETSKGDHSLNTSRRPRCSSLDTEALLAGISAPNKSDITGASPIEPEAFPARPGVTHRPQSPDTDMVLEGDRSWEKPVAPSLKPPVFPADEDVQTDTLTGTPQPGSLEALKNMLFKLQTEAAAHAAGNPTTIENLQVGAVPSNDKVEDEIPALKGYNWQEQPGGQSLEKALRHLGNLKTIVKSEKEARSRSPSPQRMRSRSYSPSRSRPT